MSKITASCNLNGHELTDIPVVNPGDWFGKTWLLEIGGSYTPLVLIVEADSASDAIDELERGAGQRLPREVEQRHRRRELRAQVVQPDAIVARADDRGATDHRTRHQREADADPVRAVGAAARVPRLRLKSLRRVVDAPVQLEPGDRRREHARVLGKVALRRQSFAAVRRRQWRR